MTIDYKESNWAVIAIIEAIPDEVFFFSWTINKPLALESSYMPTNFFLMFFIIDFGKRK